MRMLARCSGVIPSLVSYVRKKKRKESKSDADRSKEETVEESSTPVNLLDVVLDEILVDLIITFIPDAVSLSRIGSVNRRLRFLMKDKKVVKRIMESRVRHPECLSSLRDGYWTWEELAFYQELQRTCLHEENRIGFDFASTNIDSDDGEASLIEGSRSRIETVCQVLLKFPQVSVVVDAHCGVRAPPGIAPAFSLARGHVVCGAILQFLGCLVTDRIVVNPWGRRVSMNAVASSHRFGEVARKGRGWVEIYLRLGEMELPKRPSYYDGLTVHGLEEIQRPGFLW